MAYIGKKIRERKVIPLHNPIEETPEPFHPLPAAPAVPAAVPTEPEKVN